MRIRIIITVACISLLAASCAGTSEDTTTVAGPATTVEDTSTTMGETATTAGETTTTTEAGGEPESKRVIIAETSGISFSRLPSYVNRDRLNEEGWEVDTVQFSAEDLQVEAVSSGTTNFARVQALDAIRILQVGGNIVSIAAERPDEFVAISRADVADCSELDGATIAIQSEGSTYTSIYRYWLETNCGVTNVEQLVISGGENRVLALLNGEIDATNVQMADFINLNRQAPGEFQIQANFGREIPGLVGGMLVANKTWLQENRTLAVEYLTELMKDLHDANVDGSAIREAAQTYQSEADAAAFDEVYEVYIEDLGGWPECGAVDPEVTADLIGLFEQLDLIDPGLQPDEVVDFSVLEEARAAVDFCS